QRRGPRATRRPAAGGRPVGAAAGEAARRGVQEPGRAAADGHPAATHRRARRGDRAAAAVPQSSAGPSHRGPARPAAARAAPAPPDLLKVAPSLRDALKDMAQANNPRRLDVILNFTPDPRDNRWEDLLYKAAPSLSIEGRFGQLLSVRCKPAEAGPLSRLPIVSSVRLPREATSAVLRLPDDEGDEAEVLKAT